MRKITLTVRGVTSGVTGSAGRSSLIERGLSPPTHAQQQLLSLRDRPKSGWTQLMDPTYHALCQ